MARPTVVIPPHLPLCPQSSIEGVQETRIPGLGSSCYKHDQMAKYQLGWLAMGSWMLYFSSAFSFLRQMFTISVHQETQWLDSVFLGLPGPDVLILFIQTGSCPDWPRELASRAVIYIIYLFLALGPLANCMLGVGLVWNLIMHYFPSN